MSIVPRPIPGLIGLAACVAAGWGMFHLLQIGSCSTPPSDGLPACPPGSLSYFSAVAAGMTVAIIATIAGGGMIVFCGLFAAIGLAAIEAAGAPGVPADMQWLRMFGATFLAVPGMMVIVVALTAGKRRSTSVSALAFGSRYGVPRLPPTAPPVPPLPESVVAELAQLDEMRATGALSDHDFATRASEVLRRHTNG